jgi:hypothetical protein
MIQGLTAIFWGQYIVSTGSDAEYLSRTQSICLLFSLLGIKKFPLSALFAAILWLIIIVYFRPSDNLLLNPQDEDLKTKYKEQIKPAGHWLIAVSILLFVALYTEYKDYKKDQKIRQNLSRSRKA